MAGKPQTIPSNLSSRIDLLRIVLITGIMYIHVPGARPGPNAIADHASLQWLVLFFDNGLFRVGVPCLSVISGYLLAMRPPKDFRTLVGIKSRSILLPFLIFNLAAYWLVAAWQSTGCLCGFSDLANPTLTQRLTLIFAIDGNPIDLPLYFLRDLFVCLMLSPLLLALVRRWPVITLAVIAAILLWGVRTYVLLRTDILLSFSFGLAMATHRWNAMRLDRFGLAAAIPLIAVCALIATSDFNGVAETPLISAIRKICLFTAMICVWILAGKGVQSRFGPAIAERARYSFLIFCAHFPLLVPIASGLQHWGVPYPLVFLISPPLATSLIIGFYKLLERISPELLSILTGSRRSALSRRTARPEPLQEAGSGQDASIPAR